MAASTITVSGVGAVTPVGLSAGASCAALRAGIARLKELAVYAVDGPVYDMQPVVGGRVPTEWFEGEPQPTEWPGHDHFKRPHPPDRDEMVPSGIARIVELAVPAAVEAWGNAGLVKAPPKMWNLYLALGETDTARPVSDAIARALGTNPAAVSTTQAGGAGALIALQQAALDLEQKTCSLALVGGVDSLIRPEILERLDKAGVLKSAKRPEGINPGEAAAFLVVTRSEGGRPSPYPFIGSVLGVGKSEEPTGGTEEPCRAEGLAAAIRAARKTAPPLSARPLVLCDLNGERYRGLEWTMALVRTLSDLPGDADVWHPADCIGDAGAGHGALNLVWAITAMQKGYAGVDRALIWGTSAGKDRAAILLGAPPSAARAT